jgi:hypothetical protein
MISAVIPEQVDDSPSKRYLVVAPEDRIVWIATSEPQDMSPEGRKQAVYQAKIFSLLNKIKREENAIEADNYYGDDDDGCEDPPDDDVNDGSLFIEDEEQYDEQQELDELYLDTLDSEQH